MEESFVGINFGHDAGITILKKNNIFTVLSERINCFKQSSEVNHKIFSNALNLSKISKASINSVGISCTQGRVIAYNKNSFFLPNKFKFNLNEIEFFGELDKSRKGYFGHYLDKKKKWKVLQYPSRKKLIYNNLADKRISSIRNINLSLENLVTKIDAEGELKNKKIYFVDHHLAHSFDGLTKSDNLKKTLVVSLDGATMGFSKFIPITFAGASLLMINKKISKINPAMFFGGAFYSLASRFVKLTEGKLMGLSAYASSKLDQKSLKKIINKIEEPGMHNFCKSTLLPALCNVNTVKFREEVEFLTSFKSRKLPDKSLIALAANVQRIFEYYYTEFVQKKIDDEKPEKLIIVGGCALNCPSNSLLINNNPDIEIIISNSCNDEGISNGCAQFVKYYQKKEIKIKKETSPYLGEYVFQRKEIYSQADTKNYTIHKNRNIKQISNIILNEFKKNSVGMICRGRYEIGPRALCNRSLIARSDLKLNHQILNKIKNREQWRPLAPITSAKYFSKFFSGPMNPYMLATQYVKLPKNIPSVTHVDLSARCQVISNKDKLLLNLLDNLFDNNIPPVLINTSLNSKEEPILNNINRIFEFFKIYEEVKFLLFDKDIIIKKI